MALCIICMLETKIRTAYSLSPKRSAGLIVLLTTCYFPIFPCHHTLTSRLAQISQTRQPGIQVELCSAASDSIRPQWLNN